MFKFRKALIGISACLMLFFVLAVSANAESNRTGVVNGDVLNIRKSPNTSSEVLEQLTSGMKISIISSADGWYKVSYNGITGWVNSEFVTVKQVSSSSSAKINTDKVNLRESASTDALVLKTYNKGTTVKILSHTGNWYKVSASDGAVGWIFTDFITVPSTSSTKSSSSTKTAKKTTSRGTEEDQQRDAAPQNSDDDTSSVSENRQALVAYAKKFLGVRYVYGGSSPNGFDCSGFVLYVFNHFGIDLERVAADQARQGSKVSRENLRPGDVIFFDTNGGRNYVNHAGIYIGDGMFIHASSGSNAHKVTISDLSEGFYSNAYMTGRRFLK
ncbi:MAG: SH3 domain-containing protein [Bacillota bacterium]|nr:SH3 domain-containing protein [Bacillota bacterium]